MSAILLIGRARRGAWPGLNLSSWASLFAPSAPCPPGGLRLRAPLLALAAAVVVVVAATAVFGGADRAPAAASASTEGPARFDAVVTSFDGTPIAITVFRPEGASAAAPVPVVLHSHGWAGQRATTPSGIVGRLAEAGLGVVSVDARGHGDSGGFSTLHHKDAEVRDFQAVLDWIHDHLDWVRREPGTGVPKDLVAGAAGYSYGGAIQLMLASHDARLDAIAPEITWTSLPDALAPQGAVKSGWVDFLYASAKQSGTRVDPRLDAWWRAAMIDNALPPEAIAHLEGSSPDLGRIRAHALLIQGVPDGLFNLNQAVRAYDALEAAEGVDVRLFTHLTGHVAPYAQPLGTSPERRDVFQEEGPCGRHGDLVVAWLAHHLLGAPDPGIPEASFALEDGDCVRLDAYPRANETVDAGPVLAPSMAGSVLVPLREGPALLAGIPRLQAKPGALAVEARAYASLVVVGPDGGARVVDDQSSPLLVAPGKDVDVDLAGVATRLGEGDRLLLRLDGLNEWYFSNGARVPGAALLEDVRVTLPVVDG